mgnify:CR=1 FL=1
MGNKCLVGEEMFREKESFFEGGGELGSCPGGELGRCPGGKAKSLMS